MKKDTGTNFKVVLSIISAKEQMRNRKLLLTTITLLIISILFLSPFVAAANSDSSADDNIFSKIFNFFQNLFSGEKLTGHVTFTQADCDANAPGMVSYWTFNAGDAKDDYDANNGIVNGATPTTGKVGGALSFDGVNDYVNVADDSVSLRPTNVTISLWTKGDIRNNDYLISKSGSAQRFYAYLSGSQLTFCVGWYCSSSLSSTTNLLPSTWYHIAFTADGTTIKLYVNGVKEQEAANNFVFSAQAGFPLQIGGMNAWGTYWKGAIDEVAIYNRSLTATEIQEHYQNGLNNKGYCVVDQDNDSYFPPEDCNDTNPNINPGATEVCDNIDNDCNGQIDEGVQSTFYQDVDGDGHGNVAVSSRACDAPAGYVSGNTDNCIAVYNPDQVDNDLDDQGDVCDICPGDATDTCDTSGTTAKTIGSDGGTISVDNGRATVIIPSGALTEPTSLTLIEGRSNFAIQLSKGSGFILTDFDILPLGYQFNSPVTIILKYDQGDMKECNVKGSQEKQMDIFYNDGSKWIAQNAIQDCALNTFTLQTTHFSNYVAIAPADSDGDGVFDLWGDVFDNCPITPGIALYQGCNIAIKDTVALHTVNLGGPASTKTPLANAEIKVFNTNDAAFLVVYGKSPSGIEYANIYEANIGKVGYCKTDSTGTCYAGLSEVNKYLVIVKYSDSAKTVYTGNNVGIDSFVNGLASKNFQIIKTIKKNGDIQYSGGSKVVVTGSYLEIVSPDNAIWEEGSLSFVYPFIFTSDSEWTIDICGSVPAGYKIVGVYNNEGTLVANQDCIQTFVTGQTKTIAFDVLETGSPAPKFNANIKLGHKGKEQKINVNIEGKRKGIDDKRKGNGGITGAAIDALGLDNSSLLQLMTFIVSLLTLIGVIILLKKKGLFTC